MYIILYFPSSSTVYGDQTKAPFNEECPQLERELQIHIGQNI